MLRGWWAVYAGAVLAAPSMWAGNLTHSSFSLRLFGGAQNIVIRSAADCPVGDGAYTIDDGAAFVLPVGGALSSLSSSASRWLVKFSGLPPSCVFFVSGDVNGQVRTLGLPADDSRDTVIAFGSCDRFDTFGKNMVVFEEIAKLQPDMFMHMGDLHYRDITKNQASVFLEAFDEVLSLSPRQAMLRTVPMDYVWNDHDYGSNNADAYNSAKTAAREAYDAFVPHYPLQNPTQGAIFHAFTIQRVRVVVLDVNYDWYPTSQLLSEQQLQWAMGEIMNASAYRLLILVSGVPFGGASEESWGAPGRQRDQILEAAKGQTNIMVASGDAHLLAYDDGTYHANIPQLAAGPLANIGSQKGASYSGVGGDAPNCLAYKLIPNQQFGVVRVRTIGGVTSVQFRGYRIEADDSLRTVFDTTKNLPFAPALSSSQFDSWESAAGRCSIRLMPSADSAAWIMCSMTIWTVLLVGTHVLRDGKEAWARNVVSPKKMQRRALVFWFFFQFAAAIITTLLIAMLIVGFVDPSLNTFSTRSGLGYSILFMTLSLSGLIGIMVLLDRADKCRCGRYLYLTESQVEHAAEHIEVVEST